MLRLRFRRVLPGKGARLRDWLAELSERASEVRLTFVDETVRHEQAYLLETSEGEVLVYAIEFEDLERSQAAYSSSTHEIDREHKAVMAECLGERIELLPLYDVALDTDTDSNAD